MTPFPPHHVDRLVAVVQCQLVGASTKAEGQMRPEKAWKGDGKFLLRVKARFEGIDGCSVHIHGHRLFDLRVSE